MTILPQKWWIPQNCDVSQGKKNIETYRNDVGIWQYLGLGGTPLIPVPRNRGRSPKSAHETKRSHWVAFSACERRMALSMSSFIGLEKKKKLQERSLFWRWKARFPADLFFFFNPLKLQNWWNLVVVARNNWIWKLGFLLDIALGLEASTVKLDGWYPLFGISKMNRSHWA